MIALIMAIAGTLILLLIYIWVLARERREEEQRKNENNTDNFYMDNGCDYDKNHG